MYSECEMSSIRRFNKFIVRIYLESWYTSQHVVDAPYNDVQLIHRLNICNDIEIRVAGIKMMMRHSWYLSPELATLSLFSDKVSDAQKLCLMQNIQCHRGTHLLGELPKKVSDLSISRVFFETIGIDDTFMQSPPDTWMQRDSYKAACLIVRNLPCTNDCAERGVALIEKFNKSTKDEQQKQYLLQNVERHRKLYPTCKRSNLLSM